MVQKADGNGQASNSGITQRSDSGERYIPSSVRKDGTLRPERKVRTGYIPPEDIPRYQTPAKQRQLQNSLPPGSVVGLSRPPGSLQASLNGVLDTTVNNANVSKQKKDKERISMWDDDNYAAAAAAATSVPSSLADDTATPRTARSTDKPLNKTPVISRGALSQVQGLLNKELNKTNKKAVITRGTDKNKQQATNDHKSVHETETELRKRIKALEKKLRQAKELKEKPSDSLLPEQKAKIDQINDFETELETLEIKLSKLSVNLNTTPPITVSKGTSTSATKDDKDWDDIDTVEAKLSKLNV